MPVRLLLFDLGGVLLRLREPLETFGIGGSAAAFHERWLLSPAVREFERGALDPQAFACSIVKELGLSMTGDEFLERFGAWPEALFPETRALLEAIPEGVGRALLSNTNALHWEREDVGGVLEKRFDRLFLSFRTGLLKPDAPAFRQVVEAYGFRPGEIHFFDDNPRNVGAAAALGLNARLCRGAAEALSAVKALRVSYQDPRKNPGTL